MQAKNGLGEVDWSGLLKDVVGGAVAYKTADAQIDLLKAQQKQAADLQAQQQAALAFQYNPQYSPAYTSPLPQTGISTTTMLLLGGAALLVFFLMKD